MTASTAVPGRVVTFYSYKGGTGRSMALANAAWMLAANGQRVLAIDWDLEAPGLQRYFQPYLRDPKLEASDGLMDFVLAFADAARAPAADAGPDDPGWYERYADLRMYAYSVNWDGFAERGGRLDFVPAGRQDAGYSLRVNSFNWQHFYSKLGGGIFLEAVKRRLRQEYDYVLIDSRTGVSDTSGVCTVQMPDSLVVCFTLNEQSIHGAAGTAVSAFEQRRTPDGTSTLRVLPVPTRVDSSEKQRVDAARSAARARFDGLLDWLDDDQLDEYWGDVETPYIPFYSLEEVLAVFDQPRVRTSLLPSVEGLVSWISDQQITELPPIDERVRQTQIARYLRPVKPQVASSATAGHGAVFYVVYAVRDLEPTLSEFVNDLEREVAAQTGLEADRVMYFDNRDLRTGADWTVEMENSLRASECVICLVSPALLKSAVASVELEAARDQGKRILSIEWIPVSGSLAPTLSDVQFAYATQTGGFRYLAQIGKGPDYYKGLFELARSLVASWKEPRSFDAIPSVQPSAEHLLVAATTLVPIVAGRSRAMRQAHPKADNYGLRRRDWVPFPREDARTAGELVLAAADELGRRVQLTSLQRFEAWIADPASLGSAIVLIDALSAVHPEYERQLLAWDQQGSRPAHVIVCVPTLRDVDQYRERYETMATGSWPLEVVGSAEALQSAMTSALRGLPR